MTQEFNIPIIPKFSFPDVHTDLPSLDPEIDELIRKYLPKEYDDEWLDSFMYPKFSDIDPPLIPYLPGASLIQIGPSGWGKSRTLGRKVSFDNYRNKIGTVVFDNVGATIDNSLDKIRRHTDDYSRLRYCNMAGEHVVDTVTEVLRNTKNAYGLREVEREEDIGTFVVPLPMLYRKPGEDAYTVSERVVSLLEIIDERLSDAPISGLFRISGLLSSACTILTTLGLSITQLDPLLRAPHKWKEQVRRAKQSPEAYQAAEDMEAFMKLPNYKQAEYIEPLRNRFQVLRHHFPTKESFAAEKPLIDWEEVAEKGLQVYLDFRHPEPKRAKELKMYWIWNDLLEYVRERGSSRSNKPLAIIVDELSAMLTETSNTTRINNQLQDLIHARKRNANIHVYLSTQSHKSLKNISPAIADTVLECHSQLYGKITDPEFAMSLAEKYFKVDVYATKELPILEPPNEEAIKADLKKPLVEQTIRHHFQIYATYEKAEMRDNPRHDGRPVGGGDPLLWIDRTERRHIENFEAEDYPKLVNFEAVPKIKQAIFQSPEEQIREHSYKFQDLTKGNWLFARSVKEGEPSQTLEPYSTHDLDKGLYVDEEAVAKIRADLMQKHGIKLKEPELTAHDEPVDNGQKKYEVDRYTEQTMTPQTVTGYGHEKQTGVADDLSSTSKPPVIERGRRRG